jgi:competence protein ComGF
MRLKEELYKKEQEEIIQKIIDILDLDKENSITLYELDVNTEKQQKILDLIPNIRKYFKVKSIIGAKEPETCKRPYLSIIKHITKQKYNMYHSDFRININNKKEKIRTSKYIFIKKTT